MILRHDLKCVTAGCRKTPTMHGMGGESEGLCLDCICTLTLARICPKCRCSLTRPPDAPADAKHMYFCPGMKKIQPLTVTEDTFFSTPASNNGQH